MARGILGRERPGHSLQTSALLNEAYLRLVKARQRTWEDRRHFFAVAARIMRRHLIDLARARAHGQKVALEGLEEILAGRETQLEQAVSVATLLESMEVEHPDWCSVVEMRFFLGLTEEETAESLGISLRTMQRKYADARRWLYEKLEGRPAPHV
jgi:RNA polymerase sigma factor (TIGR02999 family)